MPHSYNTKSNGKDIEVIIDERDQQGSPLDTMRARGEHIKKDPVDGVSEYVKDCAHDRYMTVKEVGHYMADHPSLAYGGVGMTVLLGLGLYIVRLSKRK